MPRQKPLPPSEQQLATQAFGSTAPLHKPINPDLFSKGKLRIIGSDRVLSPAEQAIQDRETMLQAIIKHLETADPKIETLKGKMLPICSFKCYTCPIEQLCTQWWDTKVIAATSPRSIKSLFSEWSELILSDRYKTVDIAPKTKKMVYPKKNDRLALQEKDKPNPQAGEKCYCGTPYAIHTSCYLCGILLGPIHEAGLPLEITLHGVTRKLCVYCTYRTYRKSLRELGLPTIEITKKYLRYLDIKHEQERLSAGSSRVFI